MSSKLLRYNFVCLAIIVTVFYTIASFIYDKESGFYEKGYRYIVYH